MNYNKSRLFSLLFLIFASLLTANEEIVVRLSSESKLLPILMSPIEKATSDFSDAHLQALSDVLAFDLNNNATTEVVTGKSYPKQTFDGAVQFDTLKEKNVFYLTTCKADGKNLSCKATSINGKSTKLIEGITLSGDLSKDRGTIHILSDTIHKLFFGTPGISQSRILFSSGKKIGDDKWVSEIFEADYDGANLKQLTHENSYCISPLSFKGDCMFYVSYKIGQPKIYYATAKDPKPKRVSTLIGNQVTPHVSQDGTQVVFACDTLGQSDLFLQTFNPSVGALSKPRQIFTAKATASASPCFSPDGKKIAFVCNKDGSPKVYVMAIPPIGIKSKDLKPTLISKRCRENSAPAWSPDGKKLAYSAKSGGPRQIWIYDFETKEERQLTDGKGDKENPSWAENSLHLLFNSNDGVTTQLYLMNINQKKAAKITSIPGTNQFPSWKPLQ